jgi:ferritin-like metal-binding protein YciE
MHHLNNLQDFLVHELRDLFSAEQQILVALPKMVQAASSSDLKEAFSHHLDQTRTHVARLDRIFDQLDTTGAGEVCKGMQGLIQEGEGIIEAHADSAVKDAALIGAAQRVEHYEMAGYGTARTHARNLGLDDIADQLQETLDEEGDADKKLTRIAEGGWFKEGINEEAVSPMM